MNTHPQIAKICVMFNRTMFLPDRTPIKNFEVRSFSRACLQERC